MAVVNCACGPFIHEPGCRVEADYVATLPDHYDTDGKPVYLPKEYPNER